MQATPSPGRRPSVTVLTPAVREVLEAIAASHVTSCAEEVASTRAGCPGVVMALADALRTRAAVTPHRAHPSADLVLADSEAIGDLRALVGVELEAKLEPGSLSVEGGDWPSSPADRALAREVEQALGIDRDKLAAEFGLRPISVDPVHPGRWAYVADGEVAPWWVTHPRRRPVPPTLSSTENASPIRDRTAKFDASNEAFAHDMRATYGSPEAASGAVASFPAALRSPVGLLMLTVENLLLAADECGSAQTVWLAKMCSFAITKAALLGDAVGTPGAPTLEDMLDDAGGED